MNYEDQFKKYLAATEDTLEKILPRATPYPPLIHEAMRYSVFPGGKRFLQVLTLAACAAVGGNYKDAIIPAVSLELIHCYSLVHDDLPALDNDDERRGKPSCHKQFGEATAILAGDGLLTYALQILSRVKPAETAVKLLDEISTAAGSYGMIGGQIAELKTPASDLDLPRLDYISSHKTGKLIKAAAVCGALCAQASKEDLKRMTKYGEAVGLTFQFIDDLLDGDGYTRLIKLPEMHQRVRELIARAKREVRSFGKKAEGLVAMADFLLERLPQSSHVAVD